MHLSVSRWGDPLDALRLRKHGGHIVFLYRLQSSCVCMRATESRLWFVSTQTDGFSVSQRRLHTSGLTLHLAVPLLNKNVAFPLSEFMFIQNLHINKNS